MLCKCIADIPERLLRMLPVSLIVSGPRKRGGGAKSKAVKVDDFRNAWLLTMLVKSSRPKSINETYGLGITARSSKDDASGVAAARVGV